MGFRIILIKYLGAWPARGSEDTELGFYATGGE
jgi:hypothetical protein